MRKPRFLPMKNYFLFVFLIFSVSYSWGQDSFCPNDATQHTITSTFLKEDRTYWVSLSLKYSDSIQYPVIYVLDAEWRFDLIRNIAFDLGANQKIEKAIVVGIPHLDWEKKRGVDLTFSQSRIEYDGEAVDSTWYNASNSGGGLKFFNYLTQELIPDVNTKYSTNDHETLVGHSYGGYFGGYLLSLEHPFEVIHCYDPSIWFSDGEVIKRFQRSERSKPVKFHITYQPIPEFHKKKIERFIELMEADETIILTQQFYPDDTHNSLFMDSFYRGILETHR
ncbi:MAG: alpha/beta hydrolase-fold protein [Bacteroidota bacterium]